MRVAVGIDTKQRPPAQIKAFALSRGPRAQTDRAMRNSSPGSCGSGPKPHDRCRVRICVFSELCHRAGPGSLRCANGLWLMAQIAGSTTSPPTSRPWTMQSRPCRTPKVGALERRIERVIAQEKSSAATARLLRSIPGIGPVSAAMLRAEMPEPGRMTGARPQP